MRGVLKGTRRAHMSIWCRNNNLYINIAAACLVWWCEASPESVCLLGLELDAAELPDQMSFSDWPELTKIFANRFASKSQAEWSQIFDGTDACVTPVLTFEEVSSHPHNRERASFMEDAGGQESPRPAPVLSRTPAEPGLALDPAIGEHTLEVLREYGFKQADIDQMLAAGVIEGHAMKAKL